MKKSLCSIDKKEQPIKGLLHNGGVKLKAGFALIATISVMLLLFMIAVAMLTLSSVEVRSAKASKDMEEARANARLALMMAIAQLQKSAGPDTRITAPADAVADSGATAPRQLTGVWRSWEGNDHDKATGLPVVPNYQSKLEIGDFDYNSTNDGRFLGWLISSPEKDNTADNAPALVEGVDTVPLLANGSVLEVSDEVHLTPTKLSTTGSMAWWIQGENTKAFLKNKEETPTDVEDWSQRVASNSVVDAESLGFNPDEEFDKTISLKSLDLLSQSNSTSGTASKQYYHDISPYSRGLLTNTATGNWRRDLSWFSELGAIDKLPDTDLDVFNLEVNTSHKAALKALNNGKDASMYPFATGIEDSMSWNALVDYSTLYKKVQTSASGQPYFLTKYPHEESGNALSDLDEIKLSTTIARLHFVFSYYSVEGSGNDNKFTPAILVNNTATIWNPYNVGLSTINSSGDSANYFIDSFTTDASIQFPKIRFNIQVGSEQQGYNLAELFVNETSALDRAGRMRMNIAMNKSDDAIFKPGESRIFSDSGKGSYNSTVSQRVIMEAGYKPFGGVYKVFDQTFGEQDGSEQMQVGLSADFQNSVFEYNLAVSLFGATGKEGNQELSIPQSVFEKRVSIPTIQNNATLSNISDTNEEPFATIVMGLRRAVDSEVLTKGYSNTKLVLHNSTTNGDAGFEDSSYELDIKEVTDYNDTFVPYDAEDESYGVDHASFVGTSNSSISGIPRLSVMTLPTRSLLSLCELQHFDTAYNNPKPPRVANAIGNSHATPKMESDEIRNSATLQSYDHSYVNNHLFFDDWVVSSIAPEDVNDSESAEDKLTKFLSGEEPLRNSAYVVAKKMSEQEASASASDYFNDSSSYVNVASEIEVEGMFNVNSTSVEAWKALLKNQRETQVPKIVVDATASESWETVLDTASEFPFPRNVTMGDDSFSPGDTGLLTKTASFTEDQIDALAEEIVKQVKTRGPFLSLSEFINRQLSNDDELAIAGTVEAALIELSESSGATNPYADIQQAYPQMATVFDDVASIYDYPLAAEGAAVYGYPGWARQADVLRSIAPVLSARDDTFKIRAYGDSIDDQSEKVTARAWCEVTVQRQSGYVDTTDDEKLAPSNEINQLNGRQFKIISFRWLSKDEV